MCLQYEMLQGGLVRLSTQTAKALEQMKSIFPNNKPAGAVGEKHYGDDLGLFTAVLQRVVFSHVCCTVAVTQ